MKEIQLKSFDKKELHLYIWDEVSECKGILQLVHGSCEHAKRYDAFAKFLNKNGWVVIANDHRGHGKTADLSANELGYFADEDGWNIIIKDLKVVNDYIREKYQDKKIIMLGHSMGSFMARTYLIDYAESIDGCILSGTAWHAKFVLKFGMKVARKNQKKYGAKYIDMFVWKQSYKPLNKKFKREGAAGCEWLSLDQDNVKAFTQDKLCGQIFTSSAFKDMFSGILYNQSKNNIKKMDKEMPILLVAGDNDPVGNYGKGVVKTYKAFKNNKCNVQMKLYKNLRHEILFDISKGEVEADTLNFLNSCL